MDSFKDLSMTSMAVYEEKSYFRAQGNERKPGIQPSIIRITRLLNLNEFHILV